MSQNSSDRHSPLRPKPQNLPLPQATVSQPGKRRPLADSLDENADRLMDQVFGDIERLLERGAQLQLESSSAPEPSPQTAPLDSHGLEFSEAGTAMPNAADLTSSSSSLALLPKLLPRQLTREAEMAAAPDDDDTDLLLELTQAEKPQPEESQFLSKLLLTIAFASLVITSGLWFFVRYSLPQVAATANVPSATDILQARRDAEFLDYVQRAMERIDRASQQAKASAQTETGSLSSALAPLYVPLPPPPTVAALPSVPSPTARISVSPLPPITAMPIVPTPAAPAPSTAAVIPNIAPSPTHVLIGLLELGDRSAALFEIAGSPQRVQVGESIGSSGWALVSVSGEEAIVRRNGEVRSVYIGQKF